MHRIPRTAVPLLLSIALTVQAQSPPNSNPLVDSFGDPLPPGALMRLGTVRWRPSGSIAQMAFSRDGKRMASSDSTLYTNACFTIWDVAGGRELRRLDAPGVRVNSVRWLPDGRGIAIAETSQGRFIWEFTDENFTLPHQVVTGREGGKVEVVVGRVADNESYGVFTLSPDGKYVVAGKAGATASKERDIVLWDLRTQTKVADLPLPRRLGAVPGNCGRLHFTPDGRKLVAFCQPLAGDEKKKEYLVVVLDAATGKELRRFESPEPMQGSTVALSTHYLAVGLEEEDGTVPIWDLDGHQDRRLKTGHGKSGTGSGYGVSALEFSDDGATLVTGGRDQVLRIWSTATWEKLRTIERAYPSWIEKVAITRDGKRVACGGQGGIIRHFDLQTGAELDGDIGDRARVTSVQFSPDGSSVITANADGNLCIYDPATGRITRSIRIEKSIGWPSIVMAPDGTTIVAGIANKLRAWNLATGQEIKLPDAGAELKAGAVTFGDSKTLLVNHVNTVWLVDWPAGTVRRKIVLPEPREKPGESHCDAVTLSPDGRWLVTLSHRSWYREERGLRFGYGGEGVLDLWNATTGERVHRLIDSGGSGRTARFTANGDLLADIRGKLHPIGGGDIDLKGQFHLIDPLTGQLKQSFDEAPLVPGTTHRYNSAMGISPDGRTIVCTGNDGVIHLYETATGQIRRSLNRHRDYVSGVSFTRDGRRLATASFDLTALVWDTSLVGATRKTAPELTTERSELWDRLAAPDARVAYEAMTDFASRPTMALDAIRTGIKPAAAGPPDATLDRLIAELDSDNFKLRERATRELDELGESAAPGMRARLARSLPLETHRRVVQFLGKHDPTATTPIHLRELRALEILERLQSPEGRKLLGELAAGGRDARLTRAAAAALARQE